MEQKAISTKCVHILFALEKKKFDFCLSLSAYFNFEEVSTGGGGRMPVVCLYRYTLWGILNQKGAKKIFSFVL